MTAIADRRGESQGPAPDPGTSRVRGGIELLFYAGLAALTLLLVFGTLAVIALLPLVVPGFSSATITSGSMLPNLQPGDVVIAVERDEITEGTIIVYEDPRRHDLVTHRVIDVNPTAHMSPEVTPTGSTILHRSPPPTCAA